MNPGISKIHTTAADAVLPSIHVLYSLSIFPSSTWFLKSCSAFSSYPLSSANSCPTTPNAPPAADQRHYCILHSPPHWSASSSFQFLAKPSTRVALPSIEEHFTCFTDDICKRGFFARPPALCSNPHLDYFQSCDSPPQRDAC